MNEALSNEGDFARTHGVGFRYTGRNAHSYDAARGRVLSWLLTICRSRTLDALRRVDEAESHPEPDSLRPDLQIGDNDPLDLLRNVERHTTINNALAHSR